jgi:hypothetical protein
MGCERGSAPGALENARAQWLQNSTQMAAQTERLTSVSALRPMPQAPIAPATPSSADATQPVTTAPVRQLPSISVVMPKMASAAPPSTCSASSGRYRYWSKKT